MRLASSIALAAFLLGARAAAEPAELTSFERRTFEECAHRLGVTPVLVDDPEGKLIEHVDVVVLDVFDEHDPIPDFLNVFHTMSRQGVIQHELLFHEGQRYDAARVDESARNLRLLSAQLALVIVVPVAGSAPDRVRVLVIVRDIWSLRLNTAFSGNQGGLQTLTLQPSEQNLAGLHSWLSVEYGFTPDTHHFGAGIGQNRILGTSLYAALSGSVFYNRDQFEAEGSQGQFVFGDPLRDSRQRWAYGIGVYWDDRMSRHLLPSGHTLSYDAPTTPGEERIPIEFRTQRYIGGYEVTRSYGTFHKADLTLGVEVDRRRNEHTPPPGTSAEAEQDFLRTWVPVSDTRASPFAQLRTHDERYLSTSELETQALEEQFRLGPELLIRAYPASSKVGSTRNLVGLRTGAAFTWPLGNGLVRLVGSNRVEYEFDGRHDAGVVGGARLASPKVGIGRFHFDGVVTARYRNYLKRYYELGGDTRLRGYPQAGYLNSERGPLALALNTEFRTRSIELLSVHNGLAVFYDAGDVATRFRDLRLRQSVGAGLRFVFPYFNRSVLRADWAFPLNPPRGTRTLPGALYVALGQAFDMPTLGTPTVMAPDVP